MAALSTIILGSLVVAQTVQGVAAARSNAKGAKKAAGFQAGMLEEQADDATLIGQEHAKRMESAGRQLSGAQKVSQAAQGLDLSSGSAAEVRASDERLGAIDVQTELNNAAREALGLRKQAQLVRKGGQVAAQGYKNQGWSTALSGATQLAGIYNAYGKSSTPRKTSAADGFDSGGAQVRFPK